MIFAAAVILVVLILYKFKNEKSAASPEKPYRWRDLPVYYSLFLLIAAFLFISELIYIRFIISFMLIDEIIPAACTLGVLTVWCIICNFLKYGKTCYCILIAVLLLLICFPVYINYENSLEFSKENIETFRCGIANCNQALEAGKKEELKKKITEFINGMNHILSFREFTREFERNTASVSASTDGGQR